MHAAGRINSAWILTYPLRTFWPLPSIGFGPHKSSRKCFTAVRYVMMMMMMMITMTNKLATQMSRHSKIAGLCSGGRGRNIGSSVTGSARMTDTLIRTRGTMHWPYKSSCSTCSTAHGSLIGRLDRYDRKPANRNERLRVRPGTPTRTRGHCDHPSISDTYTNVKKLQFIHMLTATDDDSSHIKNSKNKKSYITITLHIVIRQCAAVYSKITFLFLLFLMCELWSSVAVNMCINCSFFYINFGCFLLMISSICVNQTFNYFVVNLCLRLGLG